MQRTKSNNSLSVQVKKHANSSSKQKAEYDGNECYISTGSTLLDLALTGTRVRGGGIPTGIAVEIFGDSSAGKTVLMCEIAGAIQRCGGDVIFNDPEARLDQEFAKLFDFSISDKTIKQPDTIAEVFEEFITWKPEGKGPHAIIADSIAALCTENEMKPQKGSKTTDDEEGTKKGYDGAKRANDFSIGFRRCIRMIKDKNYLMVFSNQIRDTMSTLPFAKKTKATGGHAPKFYASLRLEITKQKVLKNEKIIHGKAHKESYGILSKVDIIKSSVDKGYRSANIYIIDGYGIDDVRANLIYLKQNSAHKEYSIDGIEMLGSSINAAIKGIESAGLEFDLKESVIDLWEEIQEQFKTDRKPKVR